MRKVENHCLKGRLPAVITETKCSQADKSHMHRSRAAAGLFTDTASFRYRVLGPKEAPVLGEPQPDAFCPSTGFQD